MLAAFGPKRAQPLAPTTSCKMAAPRARSPDDVHITRDHDKNKCLRCKYIKLRPKWTHRLLDAGGELLITEQPDRFKPWGLGCLACSRFAASLKTVPMCAGSVAAPEPDDLAGAPWSTFCVGGGSAKTLQLVDLLRHVGRSDHKRICRFHTRAIAHSKTMVADPDVESLVTPAVASDDRNDVPHIIRLLRSSAR